MLSLWLCWHWLRTPPFHIRPGWVNVGFIITFWSGFRKTCPRRPDMWNCSVHWHHGIVCLHSFFGGHRGKKNIRCSHWDGWGWKWFAVGNQGAWKKGVCWPRLFCRHSVSHRMRRRSFYTFLWNQRHQREGSAFMELHGEDAAENFELSEDYVEVYGTFYFGIDCQIKKEKNPQQIEICGTSLGRLETQDRTGPTSYKLSQSPPRRPARFWGPSQRNDFTSGIAIPLAHFTQTHRFLHAWKQAMPGRFEKRGKKRQKEQKSKHPRVHF